MLGYFERFVVEHQWGYGYLFTNTMLICAVVLLLRAFPRTRRGVAMAVAECAACCCLYFYMDSIYYALLGDWQIGRVVMAVFTALYAALRSNYDLRARVVRGFMFYASMLVMVPVSEPVGELIWSINEAFRPWAQYLTPCLMGAMIVLEVWFLWHFSFDTGSLIGGQYLLAQLTISLVTIIIEVYAACVNISAVSRPFNVLVCLGLWIINLLTYYLFFTIDQRTRENARLTALHQKEEMEKEKYHATRLNYEELRSIRHEIKNHNFYLKALLDEGKVAEAQEYLARVSARGTRYLKSFDSGNYAVDVVMNHEMAAAREQGVTLKASVLVPRRLPFLDEDLCSLLSNLLDNAIEAAAQSGEREKVVEISIMPRQEYLFLRVTNPVDRSLPEKRRLTLETTKTKNSELHGFGTRIIRWVAEKYRGSVKYSMKDGIFCTDVMLEMPEESGDTKGVVAHDPVECSHL